MNALTEMLTLLRFDPEAGLGEIEAYLFQVLGCQEILRQAPGEGDVDRAGTLRVPLADGQELAARCAIAPPPTAVTRAEARLALELYALGLELVEARAREARHLAQIAEVQRALHPPEDLAIPGIDVAVSYHPLDEAGGDYFDIVDLAGVESARGPGGWSPVWGVMIADATGHGPAAAVETAMLDAILRTYQGGTDGGPADVLGYANRHLFTRRIRGRLMTAFAIGFDPGKQAVMYASAGHNPPLVRRGSGGLEWLDDAQGIPLAVDRNHRWENAQRTFRPGDTLLLYTDGITEALSPAGIAFGREGLTREVAMAPCDPRGLVAAVDTAVARHRGTAPVRDDRTLIAVRLAG